MGIARFASTLQSDPAKIADMDTSSALEFPSRSLALPPWKSVVSHIAAVIVAILFLGAGIYHITDPFGWQRMMEDLLVPPMFSLPLVMTLSVVETFAGVLVLVPRFRRWGAGIAALLLTAIMIYFAINYSALIGRDCSCFPWVKRTVGPAFFVGDGAMLLAALVAGWWAIPPRSKRSAAVVLGAVAVFAAVSFGSALTHQTGTKAPDSVTVDGKPYSLQHGRIFLFFYDPHCSHCDQAAKDMSKLHWKSDVTVIGIPTVDGRFAEAFLHDTGLTAKTSLDLEMLKKVFPFGDPPYGVALDNGREKGPVSHYEGSEPGDTLRKLGYVD
jgi:uncharacterized membrane protein YphA (DoxX/SURF4 family)